MFNPEKLLGGLLMGGSRRRSGLGSLISSGAALGLAGVAMEAMGHFMEISKTSTSELTHSSPPSIQTPTPSQPPPTPGVSTPPPPPGATYSSPPPPPSPPAAISSGGVDSEQASEEAVLLIRAMIAAANADGVIDENERNRILNKLKTVNLTDQEHSFIVKELASPAGLEDIVTQVESPDMAQKVYTISLMAIEVDTDAERAYMNKLARQLNLNESDLNDIYQTLKIEKS